MKTYKVTLKDCTWHTYIIQANNENEAENLAYLKFSNGEEEESVAYDVSADEIIEQKEN